MNNEVYVKKALLIDDDPLLGKLVSYGLMSSGIECIHLTSYEQAMEFLNNFLGRGRKAAGKGGKSASGLDIDVVILDYYLNDGKTGLPLCKKIRLRSDLPVVMLTGERSVQTTIKCLDEGADQYICKPFDVEELVARIRTSIRARKTRTAVAPVRSDSQITLNVGGRELDLYGSKIVLTEKESLLADLLIRNMGYPVAKDELFEHIYGHFIGIHSRCLDMLVGRLRKKLADASGKCRILSARNLGYKLVVKHHV